MKNAALSGKPYAGNPHVRFDEGEVASEKPRRGSLLYMWKFMTGAFFGLLVATTAFADNAAEIGSVRLKGYLGERLDTMIERHVIGTDVDYITAPFMEKTETSGWWQTEFWGKWMHSAVPYLGYC